MKSTCWHIIENSGRNCSRCDDARARYAARLAAERFAALEQWTRETPEGRAAVAAREAEERAQDARRTVCEAARRGAL